MPGEAPTTVNQNAATPAPDAAALLNLLAPGAQQLIVDKAGQVASDVANQLHSQSVTAISTVAGRVEEVAASVAPKVEQAVSDAIPQIKASVLADVQAVADNVLHDATTQRHIALLIVAMLGEAAILMLVFYCVPATSPQVKGIIGLASLPAFGSALVAWAATGFKTPLTPAKVTPTTP